MKHTYNTFKILMVLLSLVALKSEAQSYCTAQATSTNDDEIFNVTFGSLNNTSNCSQTGGAGSLLNLYSNYTSVVAAPIIIQGFSYPLSITVGQCNSFAYSGYVRVWIDYNQNGLFTDPGEQVYQSASTTFAVAGTVLNAGNIVVTATATPGITRMRVAARESGLPSPCGNFTWGEVEDYNIQIITPTPCSGTPGANTITVPSASICPNSTALLGLAGNYTVIGISYQWQSSTVSPVGPFTSITSATNTSFTTPSLTVNTWYQTIITCTNAGPATTATGSPVMVSGIVTSTVPYFENFEGITANNKLPNCSWAASNIPSVTQTYIGALSANRIARSGSKFATFYAYFINGSNYFYTNGIQLNAGVTYSASVWYTTEYYGYTNVTDFSLLYGTTQTTTGLVTIASASPATSPVYKSLSNTFVVPTSGIYYVAVRATSNGNYGTQYITWDDLEVIAPCSLNSPSLSLSVSSQTICKGQSVNLTATGADTYSWSNGANTAIITDSPNYTTTYSVTVTSSLSGCPTLSQTTVFVNDVPNVIVYTNKPSICPGQSANITAIGASSYTWNTSSTSAGITVSPNTTTSYTVLASNQFNCVGQAVQQIVVKPNPTVTATNNAPDPNQICRGEAVTLTGNGAVTYQWAANTLFIQSATAIVSPQQTTTYTLTGTGANGCSGVTTLVLNVSDCTGLNQITTTLNGVKVYPNPTSGLFTVELNTTSIKTVQVIDLTGRVVMSNTSSSEKVNVNISALANGIYYVKIQSENAVEVIKVVKN
jgi:hypothetical protein